MDWPDSRIASGRGRLETRKVFDPSSVPGSGVPIPGNGARVRLILTAVWAEVVGGEQVALLVGGSATGYLIGAVTPDHPSVVLRIEDVGDALISELYVSQNGGADSVTLAEVVWHPDGGHY